MALPPLPSATTASIPRLGCLRCPPDGSPCERCSDDDDGTAESAPEGAVTAQPDYSGSCMLALYPPPSLADDLAVDDGLEPAEIHLTIAYTGDAADVDPEALRVAAQALSGRPPVDAVISGHARFTGGEQDVIVALADSPQIGTLRADALTVLDEAGITVPAEHGFTAHMSLRYLGEDDPDPVGRLAAVPVSFGAISAVHGDDRTDYAFVPDGSLEESAVAELSIDLSSPQGIWADVYGRQDALYAAHTAKARRAWRKATRTLDVAAMVTAFRRHALLQPGTPAAGTDHPSPQAAKHHKRELRQMARSMAAGLLTGVNDSPDYADLLAAITAALTAASGEGFASALAVAAAEAGQPVFGWTAASRDGQHAPDRGTVTATLAATLAGAVTDLAAKLAGLAIAGADAAVILKAANAVLRDGRSPGIYLTHAMAQAIGAAMRAVYAAAHVQRLDWVTAGDTKVCAICEGYEDKNPWRAGDFPPLPAHPGCRCNPQPAAGAVIPAHFYEPYLAAA